MKPMMMTFAVWVVKKNENVFRFYLLLLFEVVYSIEIVFLAAVVLIERDSMVAEHYYNFEVADYYCYYYYLLDIWLDTIVGFVLVEMFVMDLKD
jgi:hypothetical protein